MDKGHGTEQKLELTRIVSLRHETNPTNSAMTETRIPRKDAALSEGFLFVTEKPDGIYLRPMSSATSRIPMMVSVISSVNSTPSI